MAAECHPLIACSISFVLCFCVYAKIANFSCTVCYKMFKYNKNKYKTEELPWFMMVMVELLIGLLNCLHGL